MDFPHRVKISRPLLTKSATHGGYTEGAASVVYDGYGHLEEDGRAFEAALRQDTLLQDRGGGLVHLADAEGAQLRPQDDVVVTREDGQTATGKLRRIRRRSVMRHTITIAYSV